MKNKIYKKFKMILFIILVAFFLFSIHDNLLSSFQAFRKNPRQYK